MKKYLYFRSRGKTAYGCVGAARRDGKVLVWYLQANRILGPTVRTIAGLNAAGVRWLDRKPHKSQMARCAHGPIYGSEAAANG